MRNKILTMVIGGIILTVFTGCAQHSSSVLKEDETLTHSKDAVFTKMHNDKELKKIVVKAAKEKGWRVTKFTENSIIAEKFNSGNSKATTIKIRNGIVDFDMMDGTDESDIVDLKEYIEDLTRAQEDY